MPLDAAIGEVMVNVHVILVESAAGSVVPGPGYEAVQELRTRTQVSKSSRSKD